MNVLHSITETQSAAREQTAADVTQLAEETTTFSSWSPWRGCPDNCCCDVTQHVCGGHISSTWVSSDICLFIKQVDHLYIFFCNT